MNLEPVIGLEVHAQLKTNTKIFCAFVSSWLDIYGIYFPFIPSLIFSEIMYDGCSLVKNISVTARMGEG